MGFRPHERIKESGAFRRAFDRRRWESDAVMTIYGVENGLDHARLGISVSRKKVKTAAVRNRLKRLYREAFRLSKAELPAGLDLVIVPRRPPAVFRRCPALAARPGARPGTPDQEAQAVGCGPSRHELPCAFFRLLRWPERLMIGLIVGLISVYQRTLSPLLGNACRFEPSCSRYMVESLRKYGLFRGLARGLHGCRDATRGSGRIPSAVRTHCRFYSPERPVRSRIAYPAYVVEIESSEYIELGE